MLRIVPRVFVGLLATALAAGQAPCMAAPAAPAPASAPGAAAGPLAIGRCVWEALPKATRDALVAAGPTVDDFGRAVDAIDSSLLDVARGQCPPVTSKAQADEVAAGWTATIITAWSAAQLKSRYGVSEAALQTSWRHVGPAARQALAADMVKPPEAARPEIAAQARELGLVDPAAQDLLVFWSMTQLKLAALGD
jgi:hypothetical protein